MHGHCRQGESGGGGGRRKKRDLWVSENIYSDEDERYRQDQSMHKAGYVARKAEGTHEYLKERGGVIKQYNTKNGCSAFEDEFDAAYQCFRREIYKEGTEKYTMEWHVALACRVTSSSPRRNQHALAGPRMPYTGCISI